MKTLYSSLRKSLTDTTVKGYLLRFIASYLFNSFIVYLLYLYVDNRSNLFDERNNSLFVAFILLNTIASALVAGLKISSKLLAVLDACINVFFGLRSANWTLHEQLEGPMNRARYYKMQKNFDKALETINDVIEKDPQYPEALFLKATILWEGFGNSGAAKAYLQKVMKLVSNEKEPINRWALSLNKELTGIEDSKEAT